MTVSAVRPDSRTPFGLPNLDALIGSGLSDGTLTVLAGLSAVGKSALACQAVRHASLALGRPSYYVPLEGDYRTACARILSAETGIEHHRFADTARHPFETWERDRIGAAAQHAKRCGLLIDPNVRDILDLRTRLRRTGSRPPRLLVVDYPTALADLSDADEFEHEIDTIGRGLKYIAAERRIPVLVTCPLNRRRDGAAPRIEDCGQFTGLVKAADTALILERPDDHASYARVSVAKAPAGVGGSVEVYFEAPYVRFADGPR